MRSLILVGVAAAACGPGSPGGRSADAGGVADARAPADASRPDARAIFSDFPTDPILIDRTLPPDIATQFANAAEQAGGPCLSEPAFGALFPDNWTPPFFAWFGRFDVFELTVTAPNQTGALVVYTLGSSYTMDPSLWSALTLDSIDRDLTIRCAAARSAAARRSPGRSPTARWVWCTSRPPPPRARSSTGRRRTARR
jgi:hypothetical protein